MFKERGKRGEFYLVAVIIIAIVVIGIVSIVNYASKSSFTGKVLEETKQELQIESSYILDYANYNSLTDTEINNLLENFAIDYIDTKGQGKNMYFIFGEKSDFTFMAYQSQDETLNIETSNTNQDIDPNIGVIHTNYYSTTNNVTLTLDGIRKTFDMKEGENFYFILTNKMGEEKHVVSN